MVKRREPASAKQKPSLEDIEAFASGADGGSHLPTQPSTNSLDPNAKREFKAIRVPFNGFEYSKLEEVAKKTGRSKLNVMRWAILKLAEEIEEAPK